MYAMCVDQFVVKSSIHCFFAELREIKNEQF